MPPANIVAQTISSEQAEPIEVAAPKRKGKKKKKGDGEKKEDKKEGKGKKGKKRKVIKSKRRTLKRATLSSKRSHAADAPKPKRARADDSALAAGGAPDDRAAGGYLCLQSKRLKDDRCIITCKEGKKTKQLLNLQKFTFKERLEEFTAVFLGLFREGASKEAVAGMKKKLIAGEAIDVNGVSMSL
jgi:hypothetical protein